MFARLENGMTTQTLSAALLLCSAGMIHLSQRPFNTQQLRRRLLAAEYYTGPPPERGDTVRFRYESRENHEEGIYYKAFGKVRRLDKGKKIYEIEVKENDWKRIYIVGDERILEVYKKVREDNSLSQGPPAPPAQSRRTPVTPGGPPVPPPPQASNRHLYPEDFEEKPETSQPRQVGEYSTPGYKIEDLEVAGVYGPEVFCRPRTTPSKDAQYNPPSPRSRVARGPPPARPQDFARPRPAQSSRLGANQARGRRVNRKTEPVEESSSSDTDDLFLTPEEYRAKRARKRRERSAHTRKNC